MTIDELWTAVCSNDQAAIKKYYENGGEKNLRYHHFNREHSLIMGAFRNGHMAMCELLISYGETITKDEEDELGIPKLKLIRMLGF